ncbi:MAG: GDP-L-fucose synthase, partial [Magnetococcales bacterium]|nr:GDP-L-fucose synthase [Magnetococcales bacterium]
MNKEEAIFVAGHQGLVGSAILRALRRRGFTNLLTRTRAELELTNQADVQSFFAQTRPSYVFVAAAKVGGIHANSTYPAEFIYSNLQVETNCIDAAWRNGVKKLLFLGSSCVYPRMAPQPIREEYLLSGPLEPTNEWYAIAKIAGIKLCQAYRRQYGFNAISAMPTNLYGPGDNFHPENAHVLPALMLRLHEAKLRGDPSVVIWGTGTPWREFLHVDDLADACLLLMERYEQEETINIGAGVDLTIAELVALLKRVIGYSGEIVFDHSKPDGMMKKLLDVSKITALGWQPTISLERGVQETYAWFLDQGGQVRR